jgi:MFS superfamily sulfate permease-like transporter
MSALLELGKRFESQPQSILITAVLGAGTIVLLIGLKRFVPKIPTVLVVVILGVLLGVAVDWEALGVTTVGNIPAGLPTLSLPAVSRSQIDVVLVAAVAVVFVSFAETMASARLSTDRYHDKIDGNQELLAQGFANVGSGLFGGFGVDGTLPKTVSNMNNGAKTQMASLIQAALIVLTLLFAGPVLSGLPWAILGAIVFLTIISLIRVKTIERYYRLSRSEFWLAVITGLGVIVLGPLWGVLMGILLSILLLVRRASHPDIPVLGKKPGREIYLDVAEHPDFETYPGLVILLLHGPLYYPTTNGLRVRLRELTRDVNPPVQEVILDLGATYYVDLEGADMLKSIKAELENSHVELHLAQVQKDVFTFLTADKVDEIIGRNHIHESLEEAVEAFKDGQ